MKGGSYKISYLIPGTGFHRGELDRRRRILQGYASQGVSVEIAWVKRGPNSIKSFYDAALAGPPMLKALERLEAEGFRAVIVGGFFDPHIEAAREASSIPIIGPGETSMLFASTICRRFSVVTTLQRSVSILRKQVRILGIGDRIASLRWVRIPVLRVSEDREEAEAALLEEYKRAEDEDGAEAVVPGNMSLSFLQAHKRLEKRLGIPVLDPASLSVRMAETMVSLGLTQSKKAYPLPNNSHRG